MLEPTHTPVHIHLYWPKADLAPERASFLPRAIALTCCLGGVLLLLLLTVGCARHPKPAAKPDLAPAAAFRPQTIVLDYNNGWYHPASGHESVRQIAERYKRDPELVAQLNRRKADAVPPAEEMLYIPPHNNREKLTSVLLRVRQQPELIPRTPWDPNQKRPDPRVKQKYAVKTADPWIAGKQVKQSIIETEPASKTIAAKSAGPEPRRAEAAWARTQRPAEPGKVVWPPASGTATNAEKPEGQIEIASLDGEATLPSRAAKAGEDALEAISDARANLAARVVGETQPAGTAPVPAGNGELAWPVRGTVVTKFAEGWRKSFHGIEIAASVGTPVKAARAGRVLMAQEFITYGKLIVIDHGNGLATAYGYNRELKVRAGEAVQAGQTIGLVGTAPRYGPQGKLFFQVRRNGLPVNPLQYLK